MGKRKRRERLELLEARIRGTYGVLLARGPASLDRATEMLGALIPPDERAEMQGGMDATRARITAFLAAGHASQ